MKSFSLAFLIVSRCIFHTFYPELTGNSSHSFQRHPSSQCLSLGQRLSHCQVIQTGEELRAFQV